MTDVRGEGENCGGAARVLMNVFRIALLAVTIGPTTAVLAEPPQNAKALVCRTGPGVSTQWKNEIPDVSSSRNDVTFTFSELDLTAGTARLSGPGGSSIVRMIVTVAGVTFIELVPNGGVMFTTVFAATDRGARRFLAADTRHNFILGSPLVSQFYGVCTGQF